MPGSRISLKVYFILTILTIFSLTACHGFNEQLLYNKASEYHNKGQFDKAIEIYKKLLAGDPDDKVVPDNAIMHYDLGMAYLDKGERGLAQKQVEVLKKLNRDDLAGELHNMMVLSGSL